MRHVDPLYRRHNLHVWAGIRARRRAATLLAYLDAHPEATREAHAAIRRLDDLVGEAEQLRRKL